MPNACCVTSCSEVGPANFLIPKDLERRKLWIDSAKISDYFYKRRGSVCFRHFSKSDINTSGRYYTLKKGIF